MKILHILSNNKDKEANVIIAKIIDELQQKGFYNFAAIKQSSELEEQLKRKNIKTTTPKFSGMFDLESEKVISRFTKENQIDCIFYYNAEALQYLKNIEIEKLPILHKDNKDITSELILNELENSITS